MANRAQRWRMKAKSLDKVLKTFNFPYITECAIRSALINGKTYSDSGSPFGMSKQFVYARVRKVRERAQELGLNVTRI